MNRDEIKDGVVYVSRYDAGEDNYVVFTRERDVDKAYWVRSGEGWRREDGDMLLTDSPIVEAAGNEAVFWIIPYCRIERKATPVETARFLRERPFMRRFVKAPVKFCK